MCLVAQWEDRLGEGLQMLSAAERGAPPTAPYGQQGGSLSLASTHTSCVSCACFGANVSARVLLCLPGVC